MDESIDISFVQVEMPIAIPVERNDMQDGLGSEKGDSKPVAASRTEYAQKLRGQKNVKEITKSSKTIKVLASQRTAGKTSKPSVVDAKKAAKTKANKHKSPIKKKAVTIPSKEKEPKKSTKEAALKKQGLVQKKAGAAKEDKLKKSTKEAALKKQGLAKKKAGAAKEDKPKKSAKGAALKKPIAKPSARSGKK